MVVVYFTLWAKRAAGTSISYSLTVSDFQFKKGNFGNEFVTFAKQIKKARQSGLHWKHRLIQPKMVSTDTSRCPVNIFQFYLSKLPSQLRSNDPLNLRIIHKPVSNSLWHKNVPMGQHTINSVMKRMIENSPLWNSDKKLRNYSARKTLVKKIEAKLHTKVWNYWYHWP